MAGSYARQGEAAHDLDLVESRPTARHDVDPGIPILGVSDPRLAHGASAPGLMALQRSAGNAAVASLVAPRPVQRDVEIDEMTTSVGASDAAADESGAAGAGAGSPVTSDGATTTITGGTIHLDSSMTSTGGVLQADTVIANNIVASSYSPGAGNIW